MTCLSWDGTRALHIKFSAAPGALQSKFNMSERPNIWNGLGDAYYYYYYGIILPIMHYGKCWGHWDCIVQEAAWKYRSVHAIS